MILKECMLINNKCYKSATPAKMTGIVVHDTGANNPNLKRYVQADKSQSYYAAVQTDLGTNTNGNDWNKVNDRYACVHAFIGKNAKGEIETYQTLPYNIACWGVGSGKKGSYNFNPNARIQFEICADDYKDPVYFKAVMKEAQQYCAYLCHKFGWGVNKICNHWDSYQAGYGGGHYDTYGWFKSINNIEGTNKYTMDWFRSEVQKYLNEYNKPQPKEEDILDMTKAELTALIDERIKANKTEQKVYHYWNELPSWASKPIKAMYDAKYFSGASASDLNLTLTEIKSLCWDARILKELGKITY